MQQTLGWIRACFRARPSSRRARFTPLVVEMLEERAVTTVLSSLGNVPSLLAGNSAGVGGSVSAVVEGAADGGDATSVLFVDGQTGADLVTPLDPTTTATGASDWVFSVANIDSLGAQAAFSPVNSSSNDTSTQSPSVGAAGALPGDAASGFAGLNQDAPVTQALPVTPPDLPAAGGPAGGVLSAGGPSGSSGATLAPDLGNRAAPGPATVPAGGVASAPAPTSALTGDAFISWKSVAPAGHEDPAAGINVAPLPRSSPASTGPAVPSASAAAPVLSPLVAASVSDAFSAGNLRQSPADSFRITRAPASDTPVVVPYTITFYGSRGAAISQDRVAVIAAGSDHVDVGLDVVPAGRDAGYEVVTLALPENGEYRLVPPSATLFRSGSARDCSDLTLLEAYRLGRSPEAFSTLVERHRPFVLRTCYRILGNWADAEDVTQGVFLALLRGPIRLHGALAGWLNMVAQNAAIAFLRSRSRRTRHEQRAAKPDRVLAAESAHELREELDTLLAHLPAPLRQAVHLRYLEGLSQAEAAQVVGCPRGTLAQRAAYGIRNLRQLVASRSVGR
jgi:RNA polymerase sigma-70 factor (ECF subfamily)